MCDSIPAWKSKSTINIYLFCSKYFTHTYVYAFDVIMSIEIRANESFANISDITVAPSEINARAKANPAESDFNHNQYMKIISRARSPRVTNIDNSVTRRRLSCRVVAAANFGPRELLI